MPRQPFGVRVNTWLHEAPDAQFQLNKWRFWWPALIGLQILNATLTAVIFGTDGNLQQFMGGIILAVGALLSWLGLGALFYSDGPNRQLSRSVSALDSITLLFAAAHFCFLLWALGHLYTLRGAEAKYETAAATYNAKAEKVSTDNVAIAEAARQIAQETTKAERLRNDTAYQTRKAAEAGARGILRSAPAAAVAAALSTSTVELERPVKPEKSSATFLTEWDAYIRGMNFGELALAILTLILIRNVSAKSNNLAAPTVNFFPTVSARQSAPSPAYRMSDNERQSLSPSQNANRLSLSDPDRKDALKRLREHLKAIAFHNPGRWFKADLVRGGVTIRFFERQNGHEIAIAQTTQSDKLLAAVDREDFRDRLIEELRRQEFDI